MKAMLLRIALTPVIGMAVFLRWPWEAWAAHRANRRLRALSGSALRLSYIRARV
jgi:hypothetical protein